MKISSGYFSQEPQKRGGENSWDAVKKKTGGGGEKVSGRRTLDHKTQWIINARQKRYDEVAVVGEIQDLISIDFLKPREHCEARILVF